MNKYSNAVIYKVYNKLNPEQFYIGSTIQSLTERFQRHKTTTTTSLHQFMLEKGFDNFDIELVCCYETCENKIDLRKLEQEIIEELKPTINKYRAYRSKEYTTKYKNEYRIDNKEKLSTKFVCECGREIQKREKVRHERSIFHQDFIKNLI
jgi:hypothetical protein